MVDDGRYQKVLSRTLRVLRGSRTQRELAHAAGMPVSTWSKVEQGRQSPRDETFARMAGALGYSVPVLERIVSENLLAELEGERSGLEAPAPSLAPPSEGDDELDLAEVPEGAARQLEGVLGTIGVLRRHLRNLELDLESLSRDLQVAARLSDTEPTS